MTVRESLEARTLADLITRSAAGDRAAFAELYDRTSPRVYGLALRILRDPWFAEDVTQDVFLHVWQAASSFTVGRGSAASWLTTIAHHRAVDRVRSEQARLDRERRYASHTNMICTDQVAEEVERRDERRALSDQLQLLSAVQRQSLRLSYYEGFSHREISQRLQVTVSAVKSRVRDGIIRLRECLAT